MKEYNLNYSLSQYSLLGLKNLAKNKKAPSNLLDCLSRHENDVLRSFVAQNLNTTSSTLWKLSNDSYEQTRINVAMNPNTNSYTLHVMAKKEESLNVLHEVYNNSKLNSYYKKELKKKIYNKETITMTREQLDNVLRTISK